MSNEPSFMNVDGVSIAYRYQEGRHPGLVWLGGFRSSMRGTKADQLADWACHNGHAFLRHDYSGHGESTGDFMTGSISRWLAESLAIFDACTRGPQVLVGSSMGAWIALRMIQELTNRGEKKRIAGMILIAPAADFTSDLIVPHLTEIQREMLTAKGWFERPSDYDDDAPYPYTRLLLEDGERNRVLTAPLDTWCPVHILHGLVDPDIPYTHALKLMEHLPADDVTLTLVKDGDHRLSRPQDIDLLLRIVERMVEPHS